MSRNPEDLGSVVSHSLGLAWANPPRPLTKGCVEKVVLRGVALRTVSKGEKLFSKTTLSGSPKNELEKELKFSVVAMNQAWS